MKMIRMSLCKLHCCATLLQTTNWIRIKPFRKHRIRFQPLRKNWIRIHDFSIPNLDHETKTGSVIIFNKKLLPSSFLSNPNNFLNE